MNSRVFAVIVKQDYKIIDGEGYKVNLANPYDFFYNSEQCCGSGSGKNHSGTGSEQLPMRNEFEGKLL